MGMKEYENLNVFLETKQKILEISESKGMMISYYMKFLIDEEFKKLKEG